MKKAAGKNLISWPWHMHIYSYRILWTQNSVLKTNLVTVDMYCCLFPCCTHMFRKRSERGRRKRGNSWLLTFEESTGVIPACVTGGIALSHAHLRSVFPSYSSTYKEVSLGDTRKTEKISNFLHFTRFIINILSKRSYQSLYCLSYKGIRFSVEQK